MSKFLIVAGVVGVLVASGFALSAQSAESADGGLVCTLTGESIDSCCCSVIDGKYTCGKTGKVLDQCCCKTG